MVTYIYRELTTNLEYLCMSQPIWPHTICWPYCKAKWSYTDIKRTLLTQVSVTPSPFPCTWDYEWDIQHPSVLDQQGEGSDEMTGFYHLWVSKSVRGEWHQLEWAAWWCYIMEKLSKLLAFCEVDSPHKEPEMLMFDVSCIVSLNKQLNK